MSTKFEQLLDLIVNEEMEKANELFHEIVVEKSRDIYENLIAEEEEQADEAAEDAEESVEEDAEEDAEESVEEDVEDMEESDAELEDSYVMDGGEEDEEGHDLAAGDAADDLGADVMGDEPEHEKSEDDAIFDIKNAIAELEAAFADLEAAQGEEHGHMDAGDDAEFGDEGEEDGEDESMGFMEGRRITREYVEKVSDGHGAEKKGAAEGGIAGANTGEKMPTGVNAKSPVSSGSGKPTTGANAKNILGDMKAGEGTNVGTRPAGKVGGLVKQGGDFVPSGTKNVASSASAKKPDGAALTAVKGGHGAEKKGAGPGPVGSGTGDKAGQTSVSSDKPFLKKL